MAESAPVLGRTTRYHAEIVTRRSATTVFRASLVAQNDGMAASILKRTVVLLLVSLNPLALGTAGAGLGGGSDSVIADRVQMPGELTTTALQYYEVFEIATAGGVHVREFVNRSGAVFAVAWNGPAPPNLQSLLGAHYRDFLAALKSIEHPGLHRSLRIAAAGLVVELGGHMRAYHGRVYLADALPVGVAAGDLR
jgi:hypothetical protein